MRAARTVVTFVVLTLLGAVGRSQPPVPGAAADLPFLVLGQHGIRGAADVGQIGSLRAYLADGTCRYQGKA